MSDGVLDAGLFGPGEAAQAVEADQPRAHVKTLYPANSWNPENFAREQIRGLVRQVFFSSAASPVRQVVFSAVDADTDVRSICRKVGEALALETAENIAVAGNFPQLLHKPGNAASSPDPATDRDAHPAQNAILHRPNLWLVPLADYEAAAPSTAALHSRLCKLRAEFAYSVVEAPSVGMSNEATTIAQLADGIILILSAERTRRARAFTIKERLEAARVRILGTVLSDREFPMPEGIYRRL